MASIETHISNLLCLHDCVIVPGLGGFVANYKSAVIVEERNLFQPPQKEIGFNRSLSHNDGLLVNHLCTRENISWEQSLEMIDKYVSSARKQINSGESIVLQGIGILRKDAIGNIQFSPNERNELRTDTFGLDDFHFEPLEQVTHIEKQEEPVRRLLRSRSPKYWASVAATIAGLLFFSPELKMPEHQQIDTSNIMSVISENDARPYTAESTAKTTEPAMYGFSERTEASEKGNEAAKIASSEEAIVKPYHLIAASFKLETPARQTIKNLQQQGFEQVHLMESKDGRFRVALSSFESREEAIKQLYAVREKDAFKNVWLLTEK